MSATESSAIATLPSSSSVIRSPKGKAIGDRYFMGSVPASQLRATAKSLGLKGAGLKAYVDKALRDEEASRAAAVAATVSALASKGFVADTVDVRKASATIKFIKPAPVALPPVPVVDPRIAIAEKLIANGVFKTTEEAVAAMG